MLVNTVRNHLQAGVKTPVIFLFVVLVFLAGCGEPSPEDRIRQMLADAEVAAEERNTGDVMAFVADDYRDAQGNGTEELRNFLRVTFLRYQSVHLLVRIDEIRVQDTGADVVLFVAMAGQPLPESNPLMLRADVHRLDLRLTEIDGDWRVSTAAWRRAERADLIGGGE